MLKSQHYFSFYVNIRQILIYKNYRRVIIINSLYTVQSRWIVILKFSDSWEKNWVYSEHPGKEFGKFVLSHGKFFNDAENDKGAYLEL